MQLFSIGLKLVNIDGSPILSQGKYEIATYNNDHIEAFSRVWTGLFNAEQRSNNEKFNTNHRDPMAIRYDLHDFLPKINLYGGHLADGYPLCADHPRSFLAKGARYRYTGTTSDEGIEFDIHWTASERPRFTPSSSSDLFKALCKRDSKTGKCTFPSNVALSKTLPCQGKQECGAEHVKIVKIVDGGEIGYFTHIPSPCARLTFFNGVMTYNPEKHSQSSPPQCTDPTSPIIAAPACCETSNDNLYTDWGQDKCLFFAETVSLKTAQSRCANAHPSGVAMQVCPTNAFSRKSKARQYACADTGYIWTTESCKLKVKVFGSGKISIVPPGQSLLANKGGDKHGIARFIVHWESKSFPTVDSGCAPGCTVDNAQGGSCVCDVTVTQNAVYTDIAKIPTASELSSKLFIGAPAPANEPGVYTLCTACAQQTGVKVYTRGNNASPAKLEETSLFEIENSVGKKVYLMNLLSTVGIKGNSVSGLEFSFRNPPNLMPGVGEEYPYIDEGWKRSKLRTAMIENEIDALVDHVFYHDNTAVFVALKLIRRLISSNPSPRYIKTVATAFRTGTYAGQTFSGQYGDMKATVYAVLLDREARDSMLDYDGTFGRVHEPLLKLLQFMRSLEYKSRDGREVMMKNLQEVFGQQAFQSESVFNYYDDDFDALGPMATSGLVAPESQLLTAPKTVAWLNGVVSLTGWGLTSCSDGFSLNRGFEGPGFVCNNEEITPKQSYGLLTFKATSPNNPVATVEELSLLLTSGRLTSQHSSVIQQAYANVLKLEGEQAALKRALKLILFSAEFHSTAMNTQVAGARPAGPPEASYDRKYKAVVVLFMRGGAGSYQRTQFVQICFS